MSAVVYQLCYRCGADRGSPDTTRRLCRDCWECETPLSAQARARLEAEDAAELVVGGLLGGCEALLCPCPTGPHAAVLAVLGPHRPGGVMTRPLLLDLFCGAGGAAMGYYMAGFDVVGVDIAPQPDYPFEFIQGDALDYLADHGREFDARHASPPCQASTALTKGTNKGREYPQLIPETRRLLRAIGGPSVIENVQGAAVRRDVTLCGEMFGLAVLRHRFFEIEGAQVAQPIHKPHRGRVRGWRHGTYYDGPYLAVYGDGGGKGSVAEWQQAMGIDWTSERKSIAEAIPPAYTQHIGAQLIQHVGRAAA